MKNGFPLKWNRRSIKIKMNRGNRRNNRTNARHKSMIGFVLPYILID